MSATPIADAIRRIEDRIGDERYWCKRRFHDGTKACISGAVGDEFPNLRRRDEIIDFLAEIASAWRSADWVYPSHVNDTSTHADVMLFLATALDVAEAEGL